MSKNLRDKISFFENKSFKYTDNFNKFLFSILKLSLLKFWRIFLNSKLFLIFELAEKTKLYFNSYETRMMICLIPTSCKQKK